MQPSVSRPDDPAAAQSTRPPPDALAPSAARSGLWPRLMRFMPYIHHVRSYWGVVLLATIVTAATEPAVPALLKPLLDRGFQGDSFNPWYVPAFLLLVFGIRGLAGFAADIALAKIANITDCP